MINLQVLGRLELYGDDGTVLHSVLAQPKRQALLVYLAVALPRGYHRRDTLVALLWPERDDERARASLSKAVSQLRQSIGADALLSRGHGELGIDWHHLWCDAAGFEDALDRGALAEAMALYLGDLLPGFHVDETPEFDQWLERERARLRGRAVRATLTLSEREEARGQLGTSIEWARRAAALEPFDESIIRRLMSILDKGADRAGALRVYQEFAVRLQSELESDPDAETTAVMEGIRDRPAPAASVQPLLPAPALAPAAEFIESSSLAPLRSERSRWRSRLVPVTAAVAAVITLGAWAVSLRVRPAGATADAPKATVAVLPFVVDGNPATSNLGDAMVTLLAEQFNRDGPLHALDAKSIRRRVRQVQPDAAGADSARLVVASLHPRFLLVGRVSAVGDSLHISAALFDSTAGRDPIARAQIAGTGDDVAQLAGDIAWQILATQPTGTAPRARPQVENLTTSLVALRAFLDGEQELTAGRFAAAAKAYNRAVDADTTFALAYLNLSRAANWAGDYTLSNFAAQRALRYVDRLTPLDQVRTSAWSAYQTGHPLEAERLTKLALVNDTGLAEAWYELGELRFHWGAILGWPVSEARESYEQALAIQNGDAGTMVHLARIAAAQGHIAVVDTLARRAIATGVDEPEALELRALRAGALGDRAEWERVRAAIARLDDNTALSVELMVAPYSAEFSNARDAMAPLMEPRRAARFRALGAIVASEIAMAHGHTTEAVRAVAPGPNLNPARALEYRAAFASLPFLSTPRADAARLRDELLAFHNDVLIGPGYDHLPVNSIYPPRRLYLLAMLSLRAGDTTGAMRQVRQLEQSAPNSMDDAYQADAAKLIRAEMLRARGRPAEALETLGTPHELPGHVLPVVLNYPSAHERFLRGQLLGDLARFAEALRWYDTFPDPGGYDLPYLAPAHAAMGDMYERLGKRAAARDSYGRAARLLADADPEWAPLANHARDQASALR